MPFIGSGQGVHPGKAPEQDCYYHEMPSRGFGKGVPPIKAPEQDCYYQEMLFRGSGGPPRKSSRTRLLSLGNACQRLWPGGPPRERLQNKIVITSKCLPKALAKGVPPMKGSRTRSLLPESAFQRLWSGSPRREGVPGNPGESQNEGQEDQAKRKGIPSWDLLLRKREQLNIGGSP